MHPKLPKFVELFVHIVAVTVIVVMGVRSYELVSFMVYRGYTVSSESTPDTTSSKSFTIRGYSSTKLDSAERTNNATIKPSSNDSIPTDIVTIEGIQYNVESASSDQVLRHSIEYALFIIGWFVAYFLLFKRHYKSLKKKLVALAISWVGFAFLHMGIVITLMILLKSQASAQPAIKVLSFGSFSTFSNSPLAFYFLIVFLAFLSQTTVQFLYRFKELEEADHIQSELALIRSQLRPHFFFNTLNNLYSMALESNNETLANGIQNLTGLMRYSLKHGTKEWLPLKDEWEYIQRYIELQKLRINPEKVDVSLTLNGQIDGIEVAPMILINFIENAFKHGISYENESYVHVKLTTKTDTLLLEVENSNHPSHHDTGISGIGTKQTKKLLALYYENTYTLKIQNTDECYTIKLTLPVK